MKLTWKKSWGCVVGVVGLLLAGLLGAGGWAWWSEMQAQKNRLAEFVATHPQSVALVAYTIDEQGQPVEDGYTVRINPDQPRVLASTMKLAVLAIYGQAVTDGRLDPQEPVPAAEVERYLVPGTDGGAHAAALTELGLTVDEQGLAADPAATLTLDQIAAAMMRHSGNAEMDYLLARLGPERMTAGLKQFGLAQQEPIRPVLGSTLAIFNPEDAAPTVDVNFQDRLATRWLGDPAWQAEQIAAIGQGQRRPSLAEQAAWTEQVFSRGTAGEYAALVAQIAAGRLVSPAFSTQAQGLLESVPGDEPLRLLFFDRWGAKDGLVPGVLGLVGYAQPKTGPLAGQTRVVVMLINDVPADQWAELVSSQAYYLLLVDLVNGQAPLSRPAR